MFYGTAVWDPWLIVAQIICLQCSYYITLGVFMMVFLGVRVPRLSLVYIFDYATLTSSTVTGWCVIASFLLTSLAGAVYIVFLVERASKCLDFSATLYIIHLLLCIMYGGWPSSITWWVVNGTGLALMALLAEYLCIRREQREIPMNRYRPSSPGNSGQMLACQEDGELEEQLDMLKKFHFAAGNPPSVPGKVLIPKSGHWKTIL